MIALDGCRIERAVDGRVEIVAADARNRSFPDRVTESLGVCLKFGPEHEVRADGKKLRYWIQGTQFDFYDDPKTVEAATRHAVEHLRATLA